MDPAFKNTSKIRTAEAFEGQMNPKKHGSFSTQTIVIAVFVAILIVIAIAVPLGVLLTLNKAEDDYPTSTESIAVSTPREVIIKDPDTIEHHFEPGCTVMIGTCSEITCGKVNGLNMCADVERSETITKTCKSGKTYKVQSALSCKCEVCEDQVITKIILGRPPVFPLLLALFRVTSNGGVAATKVVISIDGVKMDETDEDGNYQFNYEITDFDDEISDIELTFKPPSSSEFLMAKKLLDMNGPNVIYHLDVILQTANIKKSFKPSDPQSIELGDNGDTFADIEISSNSVVTTDGTEVTGQVEYSLGTMDTRNDDDMGYVPDTFTSAGDDTIYSKGMFNAQCITSAGDDCVIKQAKVAIEVSTQESGEILNHTSMWAFRGGVWVEIAKMELEPISSRRRKRNSNSDAILAATLDLGNEIYNMDYFGVPYCYIKVLALSNKPMNAKVKSTYRSNTDWLAFKWNYKRSWITSSTICAQVPCDPQSSVKYTYLSAVTDDGEQLHAVDTDQLAFNVEAYGITNVNISYVLHYPENWTKENDTDQLLSGKYDQSQCYNSDSPHLTFLSNVEPDETNYIPFVEGFLPFRGFVHDPMFWWQNKDWYNPCFISIGVFTTNISMDSVQADIESFGGNVESVVGQWIGTRKRNIALESEMVVDGVTYKYGFDLVEYKCSGEIYNSGGQIDQTIVKFSLPGSCKMKKVNTKLQSQVLKDGGEEFDIQDEQIKDILEIYNFEFKAPKMADHGVMRDMGIYTNHLADFKEHTHWSLKYPKQSKDVTKKSYHSMNSIHSSFMLDYIRGNGTESPINNASHDCNEKLKIKDLVSQYQLDWLFQNPYVNDSINATFIQQFVDESYLNDLINVDFLKREINGSFWNDHYCYQYGGYDWWWWWDWGYYYDYELEPEEALFMCILYNTNLQYFVDPVESLNGYVKESYINEFIEGAYIGNGSDINTFHSYTWPSSYINYTYFNEFVGSGKLKRFINGGDCDVPHDSFSFIFEC